MHQKNISNGAAYADFDNDGDYDLVTNNLNQSVTLIRNNQEAFSENNFVRIKLLGSKLNSQGIGARIWILLPSGRAMTDAMIFEESCLVIIDPHL